MGQARQLCCVWLRPAYFRGPIATLLAVSLGLSASLIFSRAYLKQHDDIDAYLKQHDDIDREFIDRGLVSARSRSVLLRAEPQAEHEHSNAGVGRVKMTPERRRLAMLFRSCACTRRMGTGDEVRLYKANRELSITHGLKHEKLGIFRPIFLEAMASGRMLLLSSKDFRISTGHNFNRTITKHRFQDYIVSLPIVLPKL